MRIEDIKGRVVQDFTVKHRVDSRANRPLHNKGSLWQVAIKSSLYNELVIGNIQKLSN
jgi:hypothetical protein